MRKQKKLIESFKEIDDCLASAQLVCTKGDGTSYDFNKFMFPLEFTSKIYRADLILKKVDDDQHKLEIKINKLNNN